MRIELESTTQSVAVVGYVISKTQHCSIELEQTSVSARCGMDCVNPLSAVRSVRSNSLVMCQSFDFSDDKLPVRQRRKHATPGSSSSARSQQPLRLLLFCPSLLFSFPFTLRSCHRVLRSHHVAANILGRHRPTPVDRRCILSRRHRRCRLRRLSHPRPAPPHPLFALVRHLAP